MTCHYYPQIILSSVLLLALSITPLSGQYLYQYFDGNDTGASAIEYYLDTNTRPNTWQVGQPQKPLFDSAVTYPNVMITDTLNYIPNSDTSSFIISVPNLWAPGGILALQWMQKLDLDSTCDAGLIEYSIDNGQTWENAFFNPYVYSFYGFDWQNVDTLSNGEIGFAGLDTNWRNIWLCFDLSWMNFYDTALFRYTLVTDSVDNQNEGWMIDNMMASLTFIHTVSESEAEKYMEVSPNPTTGRINISTSKVNQYHLIEKMELIDAESRVVQVWRRSPTKFFIDIGHHPAGLYYLKIETNLRTETFKVILER